MLEGKAGNPTLAQGGSKCCAVLLQGLSYKWSLLHTHPNTYYTHTQWKLLMDLSELLSFFHMTKHTFTIGFKKITCSNQFFLVKFRDVLLGIMQNSQISKTQSVYSKLNNILPWKTEKNSIKFTINAWQILLKLPKGVLGCSKLAKFGLKNIWYNHLRINFNKLLVKKGMEMYHF